MSLVGERGIQAGLSRYFVGSSVTRITHLSRLLLQSLTVLCCQFLLSPLPPQGSVPAALTVCHGVPQTDTWAGPGYPGGARRSLTRGLLRGLPGLHNAVLRPPDPRHTEVVPAVLQLPPCCPACSPLLSPDPLPCSRQSMDTLPPCWGQSTVPQDSLPQVAQSRLPLLP